MMVALVAIIIGGMWYLLVYSPCQADIATANAATEDVQTQIDTSMIMVTKMNSMQEEVDAAFAENDGNPVAIPRFDNADNVIASLNTILTGVDSYDLTFSDPETDDQGIARRNVSLSFDCASYAQAKAILVAISKGGFRCQIDTFTITDNAATSVQSSSGSTISSGSMASGSSAFSVEATLTYFETTLPSSGL